MNLSQSFDDEYSNKMKTLLGPLQEKLEALNPANEEEAYKLLDEFDKENEISKEEAALIVLLTLQKGAEELNNQFNQEYLSKYDDNPVEPVGVFSVWKEWGNNNIEMVVAIPSLYKKYSIQKLKNIINNFKSTEIYEDIQEEVDKRILEFIKQASIEGREASATRIDFWARDQTGDLVHDTTRSLFEENGLTKYRHVTMDDGKVRPEDAIYHNVIRVWGVGIGPGLRKGCRCWAEIP